MLLIPQGWFCSAEFFVVISSDGLLKAMYLSQLCILGRLLDSTISTPSLSVVARAVRQILKPRCIEVDLLGLISGHHLKCRSHCVPLVFLHGKKHDALLALADVVNNTTPEGPSLTQWVGLILRVTQVVGGHSGRG